MQIEKISNTIRNKKVIAKNRHLNKGHHKYTGSPGQDNIYETGFENNSPFFYTPERKLLGAIFTRAICDLEYIVRLIPDKKYRDFRETRQILDWLTSDSIEPFSCRWVLLNWCKTETASNNYMDLMLEYAKTNFPFYFRTRKKFLTNPCISM